MIFFLFFFLFNKQRWPTDKAYYIAKELLMTERTYKKDLDMINVVTLFIQFLRDSLSNYSPD